jgi:hypothetical protein
MIKSSVEKRCDEDIRKAEKEIEREGNMNKTGSLK